MDSSVHQTLNAIRSKAAEFREPSVIDDEARACAREWTALQVERAVQDHDDQRLTLRRPPSVPATPPIISPASFVRSESLTRDAPVRHARLEAREGNRLPQDRARSVDSATVADPVRQGRRTSRGHDGRASPARMGAAGVVRVHQCEKKLPS